MPRLSNDEGKMNWLHVSTMSVGDLLAAGWRRWNDPNEVNEKDMPWPHPGQTLVLIPACLYDKIPAGVEIVDIFGNKEIFEPGVTDNDHRGGMLSFGVLRTE